MGKNIVFVVGAGANHEYGFPTGAELISMVRKYLSSRHGQVNNSKPEIAADLREAIDKLDCTTVPSIDLFMQLQSKYRGNVENDFVSLFCRRGITSTILEKENHYLGDGNKRANWLEYIIAQIVQESSYDPNKLVNSRIKFITFNYDRFIEFKIREVLMKLLGVPDFGKANELTNSFAASSIIHVYGSIGKLTDVDFGATSDTGAINIYSKNINIIGDRCNEESGKTIKEIVDNAQQIHFLGFGFNEENISQLQLENSPDLRIVSGTSRGLLDAELSKIHFHFWKILNKRLVLRKGSDTCLDYVKRFVEFSPVSGVVHFKNHSTGLVRCLSLNEYCHVETSTGKAHIRVTDLKIGESAYLGGNSGEWFECVGVFDPLSNEGTPIAKKHMGI
jgi:hypothetical protein